MPSHFVDQCWSIDSTLRNKLREYTDVSFPNKFNRIYNILFRPQCYSVQKVYLPVVVCRPGVMFHGALVYNTPLSCAWPCVRARPSAASLSAFTTSPTNTAPTTMRLMHNIVVKISTPKCSLLSVCFCSMLSSESSRHILYQQRAALNSAVQ